MKITKQQIKDALESSFYLRGEKYFKSGKVVFHNPLKKDANSVNLIGKVTGSGNNEYIQEIDIKKSHFSRITINGVCSCPVGYNCKHVAAVCLSYKHQKNTVPGRQVEFWLNDIVNSHETQINDEENEILSHPQNNVGHEFITYRLFETGNINNLQIYKNKFLKNGKVSKGAKHTLDNFCFGYNLSFYKEHSDSDVESILQNMLDRFYQTPINFNDEVSYILIQKLIKTHRCFFNDSWVPLTINDKPLPVIFEWQSIDDNNVQLINNINAEHFYLIKTVPPLVINIEENRLYHLDTTIEINLLTKLINAPSIPTKMQVNVYRNLSSTLTDLQLPLPEGYKTTTLEVYPTPQITIQKQHQPSIIIQFNYAEHCIDVSSPHDKISTYQEDGKVDVIRNKQAEQQFINILENYGFDQHTINKDSIMMMSSSTDQQTALQQWNDFLNKHIETLREHGWRIEIDETFDLSFNNDSELIIESHAENDWFSLSFDIDLGDKKYPILPLVSELLNQYDDFDQLPQTLYLSAEANHYISINSEDIQPILKTIYELFDRKNHNNELNVSAFDAHLIEDLDKNITWKGSKDILTLSKKLKNFSGIETIAPPKSLTLPLRSYQQQGLDWLNFLHQFNFSGILADDMGLGKTVQTLAHLSRLKESQQLTHPSLIIVPTSLISNWKTETNKFTPNLTLLTLYGPERLDLFNDRLTHDIILTTYALIVRDAEYYEKIQFNYIILDEAQKIKNPKTKMAKTITALKSKYRLALSGTPIENHLGEMWSIFHFLMPGFLHNHTLFNKHYRTPIEKHYDQYKQQQLKKRIEPFILRRTKNDVLAELPEKTEIIKYCQFNSKQAKLYESIRISMEKKVRDIIQEKGLNRSHIHILDALLKLRQTCCDPSLLKLSSAKNINESAKLTLLMSLLEELIEKGHKILLFSQFTSMLSIIEKSIKQQKISYVKLTGSSIKRDKIIEKFTKGQADVFLISLKAGGVGLNLVEADTVIHYDPWWNPAVENQATDRAHRIGQKKAVFVYKLIVENSIEQKILELQNSKKLLQDSIYDSDGKLKEKQFSGNELMTLLGHQNSE